jgi:hypothetical protein
MYLTDKLPGASYDKDSKMYKNKSLDKFKLPKLTNSLGPLST